MRLLILRRAIENGVRAIKIAQLKCLCASASTAAVARVMRLVWLREREEERERVRRQRCRFVLTSALGFVVFSRCCYCCCCSR